MTDKIVYVAVTKGGGMDGRDFTNKSGKRMFATFSADEMMKYPNRPWCKVEKEIIDTERVKRAALAKLDPVEKLVLGVK